FVMRINSRHVLAGLLEVFAVPADLGPGVLTSLDKLDKMAAADVIDELVGRGLAFGAATDLVAAMTAHDATDGNRQALESSEPGPEGLEEVDSVVGLVRGQVPPGRVVFEPRMVRGLSYYTGPIWELTAAGVPGSLGGGGRYDHLIAQLGGPDVPATGSSLGIERILTLLPDEAGGRRGTLDVAVTVLSDDLAAPSFAFAAQARAAGFRASVYLGSSGKLGRQLRWAADQGARWCLIYGNAGREAGPVTVRGLARAGQEASPAAELTDYLASNAADARG